MKPSTIKKLALVLIGVCWMGLAPQGRAIHLTHDDVSYLGELDFGKRGKHKQESYINQLAGMALHSEISVKGKTYTRSENAFDFLPEANFAGSTKVKNGLTGVVLDGTYDYLLVRYGSKTTVVYYVGGVTGTYELPGMYEGDRAITHYSLFQSGYVRAVNEEAIQSVGASVPDGGSTLGFLGLGALSLRYLQRRLGKSFVKNIALARGSLQAS